MCKKGDLLKERSLICREKNKDAYKQQRFVVKRVVMRVCK